MSLKRFVVCGDSHALRDLCDSIGQDGLIRPSVALPLKNCRSANFELPTPLARAFCFASKGKPKRISAIALLLRLERPLAVFRRVISVRVNAINRVFWRWLKPHVGDKVGKRFSPTATDHHAPPTVARKTNIVRVIASLNHRLPVGMAGLERKAVCCANSSRGVSLTASTTRRVSPQQGVTTYGRCRSAVTTTLPHSPLALRGQARDYKNPSESLTYEVCGLWHDLNYTREHQWN